MFATIFFSFFGNERRAHRGRLRRMPGRFLAAVPGSPGPACVVVSRPGKTTFSTDFRGQAAGSSQLGKNLTAIFYAPFSSPSHIFEHSLYRCQQPAASSSSKPALGLAVARLAELCSFLQGELREDHFFQSGGHYFYVNMTRLALQNMVVVGRKLDLAHGRAPLLA